MKVPVIRIWKVFPLSPQSLPTENHGLVAGNIGRDTFGTSKEMRLSSMETSKSDWIRALYRVISDTGLH